VPALAECVFWFHPFVRWTVHEYAQTREEACDAMAIELTGAEPGGYGEMLVGFGVDRVRFGHAAASCGNRHVRQLTRRLQMLSHVPFQNRSQRALAAAAVALFAVLAIVPMRVVAAPDAALPESAGSASAAASKHAPETAVSGETSADDGAPAADPFALETGRAQSHDDAGHDAHGEQAETHGKHEDADSGYHYGWSSHHGDHFSYGLLEEGNESYTGSFSNGDWDEARRIRKAHPGRVFWFRRDGRHYVVRDRATWDRAYALLEPQRRLGQQQSELGSRQSALGEEQSRLGEQQGRLGAEQAQASQRMWRLTQQMTDASPERGAALRREIDQLSDHVMDLGDRQRELGDQQRELGDRQRELGDQQREIGDRQRAIGQTASAEIRRLADDCVKDGRAKRWES
jgi:hypothetical protein